MLPFFPHQESKTEGESRSGIILEKFEDGCIIIPLSCQTHQIAIYEKVFIIEKDSADGQQMGLKCDSLVIVDRDTKFPKVVMNKIIEKQGECPDEVLDRIHDLMTP